MEKEETMSAMKLIKSVKNAVSNKKLPKETIPYLLKAVESADAVSRTDIENQLVKMGDVAAPILVKELSNYSGKTRGLIAMALVRIGKSALIHLENEISEKDNWISNYVINEIEGSNKSLISRTESNKVLVG